MRIFRSIPQALLLILGLLCARPTGIAQAAELRSFQSGGQTIRADFYPPVGTRNSHRTILVLHGAGGMLFDGPEMRRVAQRLANDGDSVYLVHYFNRTDSLFFAGDSGMQKNFDTWLGTIRQALSWAAHEQAQRGDRSGVVGVYGYSLGAFLALAASSNNRAVGAVAEQAGGVWNNDARRIGQMPPTLLIHGRADRRVPFPQYAEPLIKLLRAHGTTVETRYYPGEGHGLSPTTQAQVREHVAEFFRRKLN